MLFLRADRSPATAPWWEQAQAAADRPTIVTELFRDDRVVCDRPEAEEALAWARVVDGWSDVTPAIWLEDSIADRLARGLGGVAPGIAPPQT